MQHIEAIHYFVGLAVLSQGFRPKGSSEPCQASEGFEETAQCLIGFSTHCQYVLAVVTSFGKGEDAG